MNKVKESLLYLVLKRGPLCCCYIRRSGLLRVVFLNHRQLLAELTSVISKQTSGLSVFSAVVSHDCQTQQRVCYSL